MKGILRKAFQSRLSIEDIVKLFSEDLKMSYILNVSYLECLPFIKKAFEYLPSTEELSNFFGR